MPNEGTRTDALMEAARKWLRGHSTMQFSSTANLSSVKYDDFKKAVDNWLDGHGSPNITGEVMVRILAAYALSREREVWEEAAKIAELTTVTATGYYKDLYESGGTNCADKIADELRARAAALKEE